MADQLERPGSNLSDAVTMKYYREALKAAIAMESAQETARSKTGVYRNVLKRAEKEGVPQESIAKMIKMRLRDPDEVVVELRDDLKLMEMTGFLPNVLVQIGKRFDVMEPTSEEQEALDAVNAEDEGARAGRAGAQRESNRHAPGSAAHAGWDRGWLDGQRVIADQMADAAKDTSVTTAEPRRGRGRPRKQAASDALETMSETEEDTAADEANGTALFGE